MLNALETMNNKCVYAFLYPDTNIPFYIGMGSFDRPYQWKKGARNWRWWEVMKELNHKPKLEIVDCFITREQAWEIEIDLIAEFGRKDIDNNGILTNRSEGGSYLLNDGKKVVKFKLTGEKVDEYDNCVKAGESVGKGRQAISMCGRGKSKSAYNYQWFYKSEVGDLDFIGPVDKIGNYGGKNTSPKPQKDILTNKCYRSKSSCRIDIWPNEPNWFIGCDEWKDRIIEITKEEYKQWKEVT